MVRRSGTARRRVQEEERKNGDKKMNADVPPDDDHDHVLVC